MKHLALDTIQSYIEDQIDDNAINEIESHLATCDRCHGIYMVLRGIGKQIGISFRKITATSLCPEDWGIGALIQGEISKELSLKLSAHISTCGYCLEKAGMYYKALGTEAVEVKTPGSWKEKATLSLSSGKSKAKSAILQNAVDYIKNLIAGLSPLPAYATAAVAILILVVWNVIPKNENIITIASSEKLAIRDTEVPSTFGFTGAGEVREVKYMEVSYKNGTVVLKWKPIEKAAGYKVALKDKEKIIYSGSTGADASVTLVKTYLQKNMLYTWVISGKTEDGRHFEYTGEFVAVK